MLSGPCSPSGETGCRLVSIFSPSPPLSCLCGNQSDCRRGKRQGARAFTLADCSSSAFRLRSWPVTGPMESLSIDRPIHSFSQSFCFDGTGDGAGRSRSPASIGWLPREGWGRNPPLATGYLSSRSSCLYCCECCCCCCRCRCLLWNVY